MKSSIESFGTGWYGIHIRLDKNDIDKLIDYLQTLQQDDSYHFHLYSIAMDTEPTGIADIQFARLLENDKSNMDIGA